MKFRRRTDSAITTATVFRKITLTDIDIIHEIRRAAILGIASQDIAKRGYTSARLAASANAIGFYKKLGYIALGSLRVDKTMPMTKEL